MDTSPALFVVILSAVLSLQANGAPQPTDHSQDRSEQRSPYGFAPEAVQMFPHKVRHRRSMSMEPPPETKTRLLNASITPTHYDLWIKPYIYSQDHTRFYFYGHVWIYLTVPRPTNQFKIHSESLDILEYYMMKDTETEWTRVDIVRAPDEHFDTLSFHTADSSHLEIGQKYALSILFRSNFRDYRVDNTFGIFLNSYLDERGRNQWMCVTSLQPNFARTMFPCLDEPQYKATFSLRVSRKRWMTSLGNTIKIREEKDSDGWITDHFETTMIIPSYLVAFAVFRKSDWYPAMTDDYHTMVTKLWVPRTEALALQGDTIRVLPEMVHYLEEYFDVGIPLKKMDILALPHYAMGGMENPGLILVQVDGITKSDTYNKYLLLAHELIHQWLGNIVTPVSWEHIWTSEGLTTHLAARIVETLHPYLTVALDETRYYWYLRVMDFDGDEGGKSVYQSDVSDDFEIFDINFVYIKGAAMADLIEHIVGPEVFRQGLREYLKRYVFSAAGIDDFLYTMEHVSGGIFNASLFRPWIYQNGYPIIHVKTDLAQKKINLKAYHFTVNYEVSNRSLNQLEEFNGPVPISMEIKYRGNSKNQFSTVCHGNTSHVLESSEVDWILVNTAHQYYKVMYDDASWGMLKSQLQRNPNVFSLPTLQGLLGDGHLLWSSGFLDDEDMTLLSHLTCGAVPDSCLWWTDVMY